MSKILDLKKSIHNKFLYKIMFESRLTPDWKIVFGTFSVMVLGIALLLVHGNLVILPYALLFGAGAMWASGGILTMFWIIQIIRKKKQQEKER